MQEKEQLERFGLNKNTAHDNTQNSKDDLSRDSHSDSRNEERREQSAASMAGAMGVQAGASFDTVQTNFAENLENIRSQVQDNKAESASLINQQLDTIRAELEHQGFKVENIEVEVGLSDNFSNQTAQNWEGMQQHNNEQTFRENLQNLNYLRALSRKNSSSDMNIENSLAHNMHITGSIVAGKENNSLQGLHIIA